MKVLVTGGAGFIGSHLTTFLVRRGCRVVVVDSLLRGNKLPPEILPDIEFIPGDIRDRTLMCRVLRGCDIVYHLAAVLGVDIVAENPMETMDVETIGMQNIVAGCLERGVSKIVYASTSGVYGKAEMSSAVTEEVNVAPRSSYAIAKRYNEIYLAGTWQEHGLKSASVRLFNVYGPRQDDRMVLPRFVGQALNGKPITVFGSGKQTRDFTFVEDSVESLVRLGDKFDGCDIFNVARGEDICIQKVAQIVKDFFKSDSPIVHVASPKARQAFEVEKRFGNSDKLFGAIQYKPATSFMEGFERTYSVAKGNE